MQRRTNRWDHPDARAEGQMVNLPPPAKRVSGVLGMFNGLEVKVLYPT